MPVIKSAIKKLRKDRIRKERNDEFRKNLDKAIKKASKLTSVTKLTAAISLLDKAAKKNVIHKNKASRLKSRLVKLASAKTVEKTKQKPKLKTKKASRKLQSTTTPQTA